VINLASYIDHTILKPTTTYIDIKKISEEADSYGFAAVCVPPPAIGWARALLRADTSVKTATVIGFPFGYSDTAAKMAEARQTIADGVDELDVVINLMSLRAGEWDKMHHEMSGLTRLIHDHGKIVKVIIESGILSDEEIIRCCEVYGPLGIDYMKTSTGYAEKGATVAAVQLMRQHLPSTVRIKASGGIRQYEFAKSLVDAGADRLGCSASVEIVKGAPAANGGY
jgi:deoxyribose-phosphate aldolase